MLRFVLNSIDVYMSPGRLSFTCAACKLHIQCLVVCTFCLKLHYTVIIKHIYTVNSVEAIQDLIKDPLHDIQSAIYKQDCCKTKYLCFCVSNFVFCTLVLMYSNIQSQ